jgi:hypothetical protein
LETIPRFVKDISAIEYTAFPGIAVDNDGSRDGCDIVFECGK